MKFFYQANWIEITWLPGSVTFVFPSPHRYQLMHVLSSDLQEHEIDTLDRMPDSNERVTRRKSIAYRDRLKT